MGLSPNPGSSLADCMAVSESPSVKGEGEAGLPLEAQMFRARLNLKI